MFYEQYAKDSILAETVMMSAIQICKDSINLLRVINDHILWITVYVWLHRSTLTRTARIVYSIASYSGSASAQILYVNQQ